MTGDGLDIDTLAGTNRPAENRWDNLSRDFLAGLASNRERNTGAPPRKFAEWNNSVIPTEAKRSGGTLFPAAFILDQARFRLFPGH